MKKLLLIMGDLATGKSTFAGILSRRYQVSVFYKDSFKETLGDTIGFSNREENLKLSVASAALMRMIFREFCLLEKDLILESNFRQTELEQLHEIAAQYGYEVLTVGLHADLNVLHQRFLHRLHHENRHSVHACGGFESYPVFVDYIRSQRNITVPGSYLEVNADTFDYQHSPPLLEQLDAFMSTGLL